jgi:hypothetical protein
MLVLKSIFYYCFYPVGTGKEKHPAAVQRVRNRIGIVVLIRSRKSGVYMGAAPFFLPGEVYLLHYAKSL